VGALKPVWSYVTGVKRGHEAAPLVVGDMMYVVTPLPNLLIAFDLKQPDANVKWIYDPHVVPSAEGVACCDVVNRGAVYSNGKIIYNLLDVETVAVDARTGKEIWRTKLGDINHGETITMAPIIAKHKVMVGNAGGEFGVRGWLTALDEDTGKIAWRGYTSGPDTDILIGPNFKPFYEADRGRDLGVSSWPPDAWKTSGGAPWGWVSYDPDLDLIYYGTANPGPWNSEQRPGDNKWTAGIFARRPETGEVIWAYQFNPHDDYDYDGVNENVLLDLPIEGQTRKVLIHPDRNGHMYVMDRATGEVLSAKPFVYTNTIKYVDLKSGQPMMNDDKRPKMGQKVMDICPSASGGKDWSPSAYSYRTGLMYLPHNNMCMEERAFQANYIAGTPYEGAETRFYAGPGGYRGEFSAWDPVNGKTLWKIPERFPVWGGALVTAGDVAFYGTMDRWFKAVDARTGQLLWKYQVSSGIVGQPVTYRGPDGKQYVAVLAGVGGWAGEVVSNGLNPKDGTGAKGLVNVMGELPKYTGPGGELYVFALP
jgi:alcohol dehydrogenase (cytochrome c)